MSRTTAIITTLATLLAATNAWWVYRVLDTGISLTYLKASHETTATQLAAAEAVINAVVKEGYTKESVIRAAQAATQDSVPFEKDGAVWVGQLGLQFNTEGRLAKVITAAAQAQ